MSFGFSAVNDSDSVMVSDTHQHLVFERRGTLTVSGGTINKQHSAAITFPTAITTTPPPKIFLKVQSSSHASITMYCVLLGSPGNWTGFRIYCAAAGTAPAPNYVFQYVVCKFVNSAPSSGFGMVIYDAAGQPVFRHDAKLVKYSKFTKTWTYTRTLSGAWFYTFFPSGITITPDDFIDVSSINRGCVIMEVYGIQYTSLRIWRSSAPVLQLVAQANSSQSDPQYVSSMRFCMAICQFPSDVYYN